MGLRFTNKDPNPAQYRTYFNFTLDEGATVVVEKKIYSNFGTSGGGGGGSGGGQGHLGVLPECPNPGLSAVLHSIEGENIAGVIVWRWTFRTDPTTAAESAKGAGVQPPQTITELSGATSQAPIQMHKSFDKIYGTYGKTMRAGRVEWLDKDPEASGGGGLSQSQSTINPMKGVDFYIKSMTVFADSKYYQSRGSVPADIANEVGKLSNPPNVESGQGNAVENQWLQISASVRPFGQGYRVDKKWMRDERGWLPELYK